MSSLKILMNLILPLDLPYLLITLPILLIFLVLLYKVLVPRLKIIGILRFGIGTGTKVFILLKQG